MTAQQSHLPVNGWADKYEFNPYSNPAAVGLEIVDQIGDWDACYSFDDLVVWKRLSDGTLWYAADAGCSCPTPFENVNGFDDLTPLTDANFDTFKDEVAKHCWSDYRARDGEADPSAGEKQEMIRRVHMALREVSHA